MMGRLALAWVPIASVPLTLWAQRDLEFPAASATWVSWPPQLPSCIFANTASGSLCQSVPFLTEGSSAPLALTSLNFVFCFLCSIVCACACWPGWEGSEEFNGKHSFKYRFS